MQSFPLVSVVIPTYNRANVVSRAIRSVLSQTYKPLELIVVDDGSDDETATALAGFSGIKTIRQKNRGVSAARNAGIVNSHGELVAFLDSDDEWRPEKLEKQISLYTPQRPLFICHSDESWMRGEKTVNQKDIHRKQGGFFFKRAVERCLISPSAVIMARALLDIVGLFDEELEAAEDYDMWLRVTSSHEVDFVDEKLVIKWAGQANQLSVITPAIDRFRVMALQKILKKPELPADYVCAARDMLIQKSVILANGFRKRGNPVEAEFYDELAREYTTRADQSG